MFFNVLSNESTFNFYGVEEMAPVSNSKVHPNPVVPRKSFKTNHALSEEATATLQLMNEQGI